MGGPQVMHGRSRITIGPGVPTMLGRRASGFHQQGKHCLPQERCAVRCCASRAEYDLQRNAFEALEDIFQCKDLFFCVTIPETQ